MYHMTRCLNKKIFLGIHVANYSLKNDCIGKMEPSNDLLQGI